MNMLQGRSLLVVPGKQGPGFKILLWFSILSGFADIFSDAALSPDDLPNSTCTILFSVAGLLRTTTYRLPAAF